MNAHFDIGRGFTDPVMQAQAVFRGLMRALGRPGLPVDLSLGDFTAPAGLQPASAAALLTLADQETPVWLDNGDSHAAAGWLRFHVGAPLASQTTQALFAVLDGASSSSPLAGFTAGEDRYPDRSATLIVDCAALSGGEKVRLTGPGIDGTVDIAPAGLRAGFWSEAMTNAARFPLGVDLLFVCDKTVIGLPRSICIERNA